MKHPKTAKDILKKLIRNFGVMFDCPYEYGIKKGTSCNEKANIGCRDCWLSAIKDLR